MAEVQLEKVGKIYPGGVRAVEDVNLSIRDGEFVVLVGPSGCGKSTTLRMIAGLEEISEGELFIEDRLVNTLPPKDRDIAMVFQNYALYPHMSVRRNLAFGLERRSKYKSRLKSLVSGDYRAARSMERADVAKRVEGAARTLGIEPLLERLPKELSGGQRQRVAVGRALVRDPKVFLFDEPLSNLDAKLRLEMRAELRQLHRRTGATMVYVTHDQEEAMTLGDRLVVMKDGLVQQCAAPTEIYAKPANRFVASFVGTPTMNFLEGRIESAAGRHRLLCGELALDLTGAALPTNPPAELTLGLRPDRIAPAGPETPDVAGLPEGHIVAIERYGDVQDLVLDCCGHRLIARVGPDVTVTEGSDLPLRLDLTQAHFFGPGEDGARL